MCIVCISGSKNDHLLIKAERLIKTAELLVEPVKYVSFGVALNERARSEQYFSISIITAYNWMHEGFIPVIFIIGKPTDVMKKEFDALRKLGAIIVFRNSKTSQVLLSQICRITAVWYIPNVRDGDLIITTDADMLVGDARPFTADLQNDIDIYNGNCCGSMYPMHSIRMNASSWKQITKNASACVEPASPITLKHGGNGWYTDQHTISKWIRESKLKVHVTRRGPRMHLWNGKRPFTDFHAATWTASKRHCKVLLGARDWADEVKSAIQRMCAS